MARDDFDDRPVRGSGELGPLDKMYRDTNIVILVLFGLCCGIVALVLSLVAYFTAKDPKAKSNALIVIVVSLILTAIGIVANVMGVFAGAVGGAR
jgi:FtsH-binding integral membrane protein